MTSVRWWWSSSLSQLYPEYFWLKYFLIWIWFETVSDYEEGFLKSLLQQKPSNKHWFSSGQGDLKFLQSSKKEFWRLDSNNCRAPTSNKLLPHWIIIKRNKKSWLSILRHVRLKGVRMRLSDWSMPHIGGLWLAESCVWEGCCEGTGQSVLGNNEFKQVTGSSHHYHIENNFQAINICWRQHLQGAESWRWGVRTGQFFSQKEFKKGNWYV